MSLRDYFSNHIYNMIIWIIIGSYNTNVVDIQNFLYWDLNSDAKIETK